MRVLVAEDQRPVRDMIVDHLEGRGFAVDAVGYGRAALATVEAVRVDAVILDSGLPDIDGMHVLTSLRVSHPELPAILLSTRNGIHDRLNGLNGGADDYIVKPFNILELEARLRAVLRRTGSRYGPTYCLGHVTYDTTTRQAQVHGNPLDLTRREAALLREFLRLPGQVITKDALEDRVYALGNTGSPNALEAAISRLRRKLTAARAGLRIETKWGLGYRMRAQATD